MNYPVKATTYHGNYYDFSNNANFATHLKQALLDIT